MVNPHWFLFLDDSATKFLLSKKKKKWSLLVLVFHCHLGFGFVPVFLQRTKNIFFLLHLVFVVRKKNIHIINS